jgi:hypothetical protein
MSCSVEIEVEKILLHKEVARLSNENKELVKRANLLDKELQSKCSINQS